MLFEEADALFGARTESREAKDRYATKAIAHLLRGIEAYEGVVVLAEERAERLRRRPRRPRLVLDID